MNGAETKAIKELFDAKIDPLVTAVDNLGKKVDTHSERIKGVEVKVEGVGNCAAHAEKVESTKEAIAIVDEKTKVNSDRTWGLAIVLLVAVLGLVATIIFK